MDDQNSVDDESGEKSVFSSPVSAENTSKEDNSMEQESTSSPEKPPPKSQKSPGKGSTKKAVVKSKENIFKRLSIASITKGSRPPKPKKIKEKPSTDVHDDDDDEEKLVIDLPADADKNPVQKVIKVKRLSSGKKLSKTGSSKKTANEEGSLSKESAESNKLSNQASSATSKVTIKSENGLLVSEAKIKPFLYGWRREVVLRAIVEPDSKKKSPADIYYFNPRGKKLRSMPEIISHLRDTQEPDLTPENFTFLKEAIYQPPMETVRQAKQRAGKNSSFESSFTDTPPPQKSAKKKIPATTPKASSTASTTPPTPVSSLVLVVPSAVEGIENSTPNEDPKLLGKRGRKIKSLPPDFMSPDDVSRKKYISTMKPVLVPNKPSPKHSDLNCETSTDKTVKKPAVKRKIAPKTISSNEQSDSPPAKKMSILSPHQIKKEVLSGSDTEKSPAPHRSTPDPNSLLTGSQSPQKEDSLDSNNKRPKVCFTFGKLNPIANIENNNNVFENNVDCKKSQVIPFKKRRVTSAEPIKVSQNDRMCSLTCPGRQCQLPTLHCHICLCLFHPECVGFLNGMPTEEEFKCQRCLYQPYLKASEPKPSSGTKSSVNGKNSQDPEDDERLEENIASSDDDENFMTVPPERVLDPIELAKDPTAMLKVADLTARPLTDVNAVENGSDPTGADNKTDSLEAEKNATEKPEILPDSVLDKPNSPIDMQIDSVAETTVSPTCESSTSPVTTNVNPLVSLASIATAANNSVGQNDIDQGSLSSINSNGVPLIMPLMNPAMTIPGQLGQSPIGPLQIPGSMSPLQLQQQMMRPVMNLNSALQMPSNQKPAIPVNLLPNAAPIIVGSQVLTPVSINLTGIAKGTLIYTNNPTLRFLLPSTSGLASFVVPPGGATLGCSSNPNSSETLQNSSAVLSQFLPVNPPVQVINVKEHSLCDLMLKIPVNDGHPFSPKVILKTSNMEETNSAEKENKSDDENIVKEKELPVSNELEVEKNVTSVSESVQKQSDTELLDVNTVVSITALNEPSCDKLLESNVDSTQKAESVKECADSNQKDEGTDQNDISSAVEIEVRATPAIEKETNDIESAVETITSSALETITSSPLETVISSALDNENEKVVSASESDKVAEIGTKEGEKKEDPFVDEFCDITGPVLSPSNAVFEDDEIYYPVDVESLNWWLSESENEEGKREEEPESEYRPQTPIVLSAVEFDGSSRIITTRLANRGASVSADSESCARLSKYIRPVRDFMHNEEHSYNLADQAHILKKKKFVTLKLPRKPFHSIQSASESLNQVFEYLNIPELLNASLVCKTWKKISSQSHLWSTVKLKGVRILDWKLCASALEQHNTSLLDMRGIVQRPDQWHDFLASLFRLRKVQGVVFGEVPAWVITNVVNGLPDLLCLESEEIVNDSRELVHMDPGVLAQLQQMNILRIRAPDGMQVPDLKLYGGLSSLGLLPNLTHLSLTSLRKLDNDDVVFLEHLPHLQVLEIGQCRTWTELAYHRLGKLRSLRRLRLEMGGAFADRGLANALIQMSRLQELTLLAYRITSSMAASIRRLRHLWHLTIWPDMSSEGAMVVYNTLQAVRNLKRLQSFSWGIIYQDDTSTRYSRKHGKGKYKEASEVDEWWSEELRNTPRAKGIKIPMLKAFSDTLPVSGKNSKSVSADSTKSSEPTSPSTPAVPGMEQGLIGVGHLRQKLQKLLPDSEIYVYQVPESLLSRVYGGSCNVITTTTCVNGKNATNNNNNNTVMSENSSSPR